MRMINILSDIACHGSHSRNSLYLSPIY